MVILAEAQKLGCRIVSPVNDCITEKRRAQTATDRHRKAPLCTRRVPETVLWI